MSLFRLASVACAALACGTFAHAGHIVAATSGLSGTDHVIDFGANVLPNFTPVSTEFPGIVVQHASYFTTGTVNNLNGGFLTNDSSGPPNTLRITFAAPIRDLSFVYHQISTAAPSNFRALLSGAVVDSFSNLSNQTQPNNFFGFTDVVFDTLELDFQADFNVDLLAFNDAGGPGTAFCFCDGSGAPAPCGNTGAAGSGCANSASAGGATLTASGSPTVGADTLVLSATGLVPGQPGLYFQGDNQVNGGAGALFGDGLRCAGGGVVRLGVRAANAGGASDTSGFALPISVKGGVSAGDTRSYQLWYRDPVGGPCGSAFNLTNGYTIQW